MERGNDQRRAILEEIRDVRSQAADMTKLLAAGVLDDEDWDRVGLLLVSCRQERKRLEERLTDIDAMLAPAAGGKREQ
jgi:hypothetical protein